MRFWWQWFSRGTDDLGRVEPWNPVIAERHWANTERMLLGRCGPTKVVGNRKHDEFWAAVENKDERPVLRIATRKKA